MANPENRQEWIDAAKCLAIIAVLVDHSGGILYFNDRIAYASYFSVCVFVLIMGITAFWSYQKNDKKAQDVVRNRCSRIFVPYLVATFIYCIYCYRSFSLEVFLKHVIHFDASPPFYYVLLYMQMTIISPVLYHILSIASKKKGGWLIEITAAFAVILLSILTTNDTDILGVSGGGGKLFGGTYLILLYLGMWFAKYCRKIQLKPGTALAGTAAGFVLAVQWWRFFSADRMRLDRMLPFGPGYNPPSISLMVYAVLITGTVFFAGHISKDWLGGVYQRAFSAAARLGKHTLYIFLYHKLLLDILCVIDVHTTGMLIDHMWFKRAAYMLGMIFGSLLIEAVLKKAGMLIRASYHNETSLQRK